MSVSLETDLIAPFAFCNYWNLSLSCSFGVPSDDLHFRKSSTLRLFPCSSWQGERSPWATLLQLPISGGKTGCGKSLAGCHSKRPWELDTRCRHLALLFADGKTIPWALGEAKPAFQRCRSLVFNSSFRYKDGRDTCWNNYLLLSPRAVQLVVPKHK